MTACPGCRRVFAFGAAPAGRTARPGTRVIPFFFCAGGLPAGNTACPTLRIVFPLFVSNDSSAIRIRLHTVYGLHATCPRAPSVLSRQAGEGIHSAGRVASRRYVCDRQSADVYKMKPTMSTTRSVFPGPFTNTFSAPPVLVVVAALSVTNAKLSTTAPFG